MVLYTGQNVLASVLTIQMQIQFEEEQFWSKSSQMCIWKPPLTKHHGDQQFTWNNILFHQLDDTSSVSPLAEYWKYYTPPFCQKYPSELL